MDPNKMRAIAVRCRELSRVAVRDDIREQLRQWAEEFDAQADAIERTADYSGTERGR